MNKNDTEAFKESAGEFSGEFLHTSRRLFLNKRMGYFLAVVLFTFFLGSVFTTLFDYWIASPAQAFCRFTTWCSPQAIRVRHGIYIPPVERVQALSELTTMRYNYANIVTGQTDMPGLLAGLYGESLVMVAVGHIEAGINIADISEDDIIYDRENNILTITLPAPTIQDCFLDESETYIAQRNTGVFAGSSPHLDTGTRRYAVAQFRDLALEDGILEAAAEQTLSVMREFMVSATEAQTNLIMQPINPDAPFPETCG
jgi:hypothetical protein